MKKRTRYEENEALVAKKASAAIDRTWLTHISISVGIKYKYVILLLLIVVLYLEAGSTFQQLCQRCLQHFLDHFSLSIADIEIIQDLHLSLSDVFTLRYAEIDSFVRLLSDALRHHQQR